jgi:PTS system galactitol-specific IIA component
MEALEELMVGSAILLGYPAKDAEGVISELGRLLFEAGHVKESFVQAALDREMSLPTGLPLMGGHNAAIPHTDVEHVLKPSIAFATLAQPVNFHNMVMPEELIPVSIVFLLALDQPKSQVGMLQEIAGILQKPVLIENLVKAQSSEEVVEIIKNRADTQ